MARSSASRSRARSPRSRGCCCSTSRPPGSTTASVIEFASLIKRIRDEFDLTVLLVEHQMGLVMGLCGRLLVLHLGQLLAEGTRRKSAPIRR